MMLLLFLCVAVLATLLSSAAASTPERLFAANVVLQPDAAGVVRAKARIDFVGTCDLRSLTTAVKTLCETDDDGMVSFAPPDEVLQQRGVAWTLHGGDSDALIAGPLRFGKLFMCAGQSNMNLEVRHDLAAQELVARRDERIFSFSFAENRRFTGNTWANDENTVLHTSAICYSFAIEYLKDHPDTAHIGLITNAVPGAKVRAYLPPLGNAWEDTVVPLAPFTFEAILWYQGETDVRKHLLRRFYRRHAVEAFAAMRNLWPQARIAVVGLSMLIPSGGRLRHLVWFREQQRLVAEHDLQNAVYVTTHDLADPFVRSQTMPRSGCASAGSAYFGFSDWCAKNQVTPVVDPLAVHTRLKARIGFRINQALHGRAAPRIVSCKRVGLRRFEVKLSEAVSPANFNADVWRWRRRNWSQTYNTVGSRMSQVALSADGQSVQLEHDSSWRGDIRLLFAWRPDPCCENEGTACQPENCGMIGVTSHRPLAPQTIECS